MSSKRVLAIDAIRGAALFGVLAVNTYDWLAGPSSAADHAVNTIVVFLLQDKVWPLFSFVFGLGFAIQQERSTASGRPIFWVHARRMPVLYGFGIVLIELLAGNSILERYAMLGILLLLPSGFPPRHVVVAALVTLLVTVLAQRAAVVLYRSGGVTLWVQSLFYSATMLEIFVMFLIGLFSGKCRHC